MLSQFPPSSIANTPIQAPSQSFHQWILPIADSGIKLRYVNQTHMGRVSILIPAEQWTHSMICNNGSIIEVLLQTHYWFLAIGVVLGHDVTGGLNTFTQAYGYITLISESEMIDTSFLSWRAYKTLFQHLTIEVISSACTSNCSQIRLLIISQSWFWSLFVIYSLYVYFG